MFSRPPFCEEKERLLSEFTGAARDYLRIMDNERNPTRNLEHSLRLISSYGVCWQNF